ncbi:MAG: DUF6476 family protein [Mangrovicoccus sp.]|nr:DUF6476 family protein [Mangrovicoccus sp.]
MDEDHATQAEPANLRFLRVLVTILTAVMIGGVATIVLLLVMKLNERPALPALPAALSLPEGAEASAVTYGPGYIAVLDRGARVLLYTPEGDYLGQTEILPAQD